MSHVYSFLARSRDVLLLMGLLVSVINCGGSSSDSGSNSSFAAANDDYDLAAGVQVSFGASQGVLANDKGGGLTVSVLSPPRQAVAGSFQLNSDGSFSYRADTDVVLSDSFQYEVSNSQGSTDTASVTLNIYPKPSTMPDTYAVSPGVVLEVDADQGVLQNDVSPRGQQFVQLVNAPQKSSEFTLNADGSFRYLAPAGQGGSDTFSYRVSDGLQQSAAEIVTLTLQSGELVGANDSFQIVSGEVLKLAGPQGILENDQGTTNELVVSVAKLPDHAIDFSVSSEGDLVYRTVSQSVSSDSFSYYLKQGGVQRGPVDVLISISQPALSEDPPGAYDRCIEYSAGQTLDGILVAEGIPSPRFELLSEPRFGELTAYDAASGSFTYQRRSNHRGQDSFSYRILTADGNTVADASQELIALPYRIMPVGDSITSGVELFTQADGDQPPPATRVGYRKFLVDSLKADGFAVDLVGSRNEGYNINGFSDTQHNGYPGRDDSFVNSSISQWLNDAAADIILLHIGTNGTKSHVDNIRGIISKVNVWETAENNPLSVMLATLITRTDSQSHANRIDNFNNLLENYAVAQKEAGDRVYLVDQNAALGTGEFLSADNLHPTAQGYQRMSAEWTRRLKQTSVLRKCDD